MASRPGRSKRPHGAGKVSVRTTMRLDPDVHVRVERAAEALRVSRDVYINALLAREELDEDGRPTWWTDPVPADQGALPLPTA